MVVSLGPGKFYGSSLPRPRFYTDVKFNEERVDPPKPVLDSLMSWAEEAHWSMGGLNVKRLRFQGRIEGNMETIRAEHERSEKKSAKKLEKKSEKKSEVEEVAAEVSPEAPPAPFMVKRKRRFVVDEDEDESGGEESGRRGAVRKLGDDFEKVAEECGMNKEGQGVATRARGGRSEGLEPDKGKSNGNKLKGKGKSKGNGEIGVRVSPRLAKRG